MPLDDSTYGTVEVFAIVINDALGQWVVAVRPNGSVVYGPGFTADTAAREFWNAIFKYVSPGATNAS